MVIFFNSICTSVGVGLGAVFFLTAILHIKKINYICISCLYTKPMIENNVFSRNIVLADAKIGQI